jgi:hypothetical protein
MGKSKIDRAVEKITEKDIGKIHKVIKPKKEFHPRKISKILTAIVIVIALIFIFLFWKFSVVDFPAFKQYEGKSKIYLLSYCDIEKFSCKTTKFEDGSINLDIKSKFNEPIAIKDISAGNCNNELNISLSSKNKTLVNIYCASYHDISLIYKGVSDIDHRVSGKVFYFLDLTEAFKIFYKD